MLNTLRQKTGQPVRLPLRDFASGEMKGKSDPADLWENKTQIFEEGQKFRMIRICHITSAHGRYDGRILRKECVSLAGNGFDVSLVVNDDLPAEIYKGVNIIPTGNRVGRRISARRIKSHDDILKKALETGAEVYHLHDPDLLLIAMKLKKRGGNVIFDSHEFYYECIKIKKKLPRIFMLAIAFAYKKYETFVCKRIDGVVEVSTVNDKNGKAYDYFADRSRKSVFIGNYPLSAGYRTSEAHRKETAGGNFTVCYAGGLEHERGITHLIDACYRAGCRLILAGAFSSKDYQKSLEKEESYSCVDYRGQVSFEEVLAIYAESDAGAATLLNYGQFYMCENFATKVYEYFQNKLPVIISDYPYGLRMNEKYHYGITVTPDDINSVASAIEYLRDNPEEAKIMGGNGYRLYKDCFNWEKEEKKLIDFYREIIGEFNRHQEGTQSAKGISPPDNDFPLNIIKDEGNKGN